MNQQAKESPLWKDNEAFWNRLPDAPTSATVCRDPRLKPPATTEKELKAMQPDPKMQERIKVLSEKLKMGDNPTLTDMQAIMQKPEYKEMMELTQQLVNNPAMQAYVKKQEVWGKEKDQYDAKTKAWLKSSGFEAIDAWKGRVVALYDSNDKSQTSNITFVTTKRYYDRSSGRQVWSGGCTLIAQMDGLAEKKYDRPNPATLQFFIGQEGYFLKYAGASMNLRGNNTTLYQPFVSTHLFEIASPKMLNLPGILMSPGDSYVGFPFSSNSGNAKKLTGRMKITRPDGSIYRIGWELSPV
jgi:hypothetical protein